MGSSMQCMDTRREGYHSYLLRLWRAGSSATWLAAVQSTATEQVMYLPNLTALYAFLEAQMAVERASSAPDNAAAAHLTGMPSPLKWDDGEDNA